jgi:hypothetical protein
LADKKLNNTIYITQTNNYIVQEDEESAKSGETQTRPCKVLTTRQETKTRNKDKKQSQETKSRNKDKKQRQETKTRNKDKDKDKKQRQETKTRNKDKAD